MLLHRTTKSVQAWSKSQRTKKQTIGFVPTMGFLHDGHRSLVSLAKKRADRVLVSIFVNPKQFGPNEDLSRYPSDQSGDLAKLKSWGADAVFLPKPTEIYPEGFQTLVSVASLSDGLCGASRPGHFDGVATVVLKLFNMVQPDLAIFGEKDFQQLAIIRRMTLDLNLPIKIVGSPTVREKDGLAMSSRNSYLTEQERVVAPSFYQALKAAANLGKTGQPRQNLAKIFQQTLHPSFKIDYFACVDAQTLEPQAKAIPGKTRLIAAVFLGKTRLIDNVSC